MPAHPRPPGDPGPTGSPLSSTSRPSDVGRPGAHPSVDALADAAEGLGGSEAIAAIQAHRDTCAACRDTAAALAAVSTMLAAEPAPVMPPEVFARLEAVVRHENGQRTSHPSAPTPRMPRATLGNFGDHLVAPRKRRLLLPALVAATAASVTGFGGYVLSASSGLNEPPVSSPAYVSASQLGSEASELRSGQDLSAHRFSRAWNCVRGVTQGRITDIASVVIDGEPALLVYTKRSGRTQVTVVTGCDDEPKAGPSTTLPR